MNIDSVLPLTSKNATKIKKTLLEKLTTPEQFEQFTNGLKEIVVKKEIYQLTEEENRAIQAKIYKKFAGEKLGEFVTAKSLTSKKDTKLLPGSFHIMDIYVSAITLGIFGFIVGYNQNKERRVQLQYGAIGFMFGLILDGTLHVLRLKNQKYEKQKHDLIKMSEIKKEQSQEELSAKKND